MLNIAVVLSFPEVAEEGGGEMWGIWKFYGDFTANGSPLSFEEGVSGDLRPNSTLLLKKMQGRLAKLETGNKLYFSSIEAGSKVQVTFHRSREQVTAPLLPNHTDSPRSNRAFC